MKNPSEAENWNKTTGRFLTKEEEKQAIDKMLREREAAARHRQIFREDIGRDIDEGFDLGPV
jgi:hypothetical protein